jgi:hypothetical protein
MKFMCDSTTVYRTVEHGPKLKNLQKGDRCRNTAEEGGSAENLKKTAD